MPGGARNRSSARACPRSSASTAARRSAWPAEPASRNAGRRSGGSSSASWKSVSIAAKSPLLGFIGDPAPEERACERPVALGRAQRHSEQLGGILHLEPAVVAQLDEARLPRIEARELVERRVERDEVERALLEHRERVVERNRPPRRAVAAPPLLPPLPARVVDQDPPHRLRRDAEELSAVLEADGALLQELQVRLVDERRRLERVALPLAL